MASKWDTGFTVTLLICALVTTGLVVRRELVQSPAAPTPKPKFIKEWRSALRESVQLGFPSAPVQLIEFADFECPFCANLHKSLTALRIRYPRELALSYVHFPLPGHRFAEPAARAAECAREQGRFEAMHDRLFEQQDQLGLKSWNEFATEASVPNIAAFEFCIKNTAPVPRIEADKRLGNQLEVKGTPTLIINGWKLAQPPTLDELDSMVKAILAGREPVSSAGRT